MLFWTNGFLRAQIVVDLRCTDDWAKPIVPLGLSLGYVQATWSQLTGELWICRTSGTTEIATACRPSHRFAG